MSSETGTIVVQEIQQMLWELREVRAAYELLAADIKTERDKIIPDSVQMELDAYDAEVEPQLKAAKEACDALAKRVRLATASYGATVKGDGLSAIVYDKVSWDDKGLKRYLATVLDQSALTFALQFRNAKVVCQVRETR